MHRWIWYTLRTGLLLGLAFVLAVTFAPMTFRAARLLRHQPAPIGAKAYYLALGDSLAFGYQPDLDWIDGYTNDLFSDLATHGAQRYDNLACTDESSVTLIKGGCPYAWLRKHLYSGSQLQAAVSYLHAHAGQVSPVTLDIGANDLIPDLDSARCTINPKWESDLVTLDTNLRNVILPQLEAAMTVNGQMTGDLVLLNYYDPYQTTCPKTVPYIQMLNQHLAADAAASSSIIVVDISSVFTPPVGNHGAAVVSQVCSYTWMCGKLKNIHPNSTGYAAMASAIEHVITY